MRKLKILSLFWHSVNLDTIPQEYLDGTNPTKSVFIDQIKFISDNYTPISITEFMEITSNRNKKHFYSKPPVLLGFDDGFRNVIKVALPILEEFKIPAVLFVLGEVINNPDFVVWYVERIHLFRKAEKKTIVFDNMNINMNSQEDCAKLKRHFKNSFFACRSETKRQSLLSKLADSLGVKRPVASDLDDDLRFITKNDLKILDSSILTVSSHAMTHRYLSRLTFEEQLYELEQSNLILKSNHPSYYPIISYPGGSLNAATIDIAQRIYKAGFAVLLGSSYRNLYAYPRVGLGYCTQSELANLVSKKRINYIYPVKRFLHKTGIRRVKDAY